MKCFTAFTAFILSLAVTATAQDLPYVTVTYDTSYDESATPISNLACASQLQEAGYTTYGSISDYPNIGGFSNVTQTDDDACMSCWVLQFAGNFAEVFVVNSANEGFVVSEETMQILTNDVTIYSEVQAQVLGAC